MIKKFFATIWIAAVRLYSVVLMIAVPSGVALAQVEGDSFTSGNPFVDFICPVIGIVRDTGFPIVALLAIMLGIAMLLLSKGGDDKGMVDIIKVIGGIAVGLGLLLFLYFTLEDWIVESFGGTVCGIQ